MATISNKEMLGSEEMAQFSNMLATHCTKLPVNDIATLLLL